LLIYNKFNLARLFCTARSAARMFLATRQWRLIELRCEVVTEASSEIEEKVNIVFAAFTL